MIGRRWIALPMKGILNGRVKIVSGIERSGIHPGINIAPLSEKSLFKRP